MPDPQSPDPVTDALKPLAVPDEVKARIWDAYHQSTSPDDLATRLKGLPGGDDLKAKLWDLKSADHPAPAGGNDAFLNELNSTVAGAKTPQSTEPLGAVGRALSNVWEQIDPVTAVEGAYGAVRHPIDTATNIAAAHKALYDKAKDSFAKGDYVNGAVHGLNMLIPLIGPTMDQAAEQIASGDVAGGIGKAAGLGLAIEGPKAAMSGVRAASEATRLLPNALADAADAASTKRIVDVIAPKVGANKAKFVAMAAKAAPELARDPEMGALSRQGMVENVSKRMDQIGADMDAANTARPQGLSAPVADVVADLNAQKARYTTSAGRVSDPYKAKVAQIDKAIEDVQAHGQTISYDDLKKVRQSYDERGKAVYNPAITPNYDVVKAEATGAADAAGAMRDRMAQMDPNMTGPNADYHLYKGVRDVLKATEETEMGRPTKGREYAAKISGSVAGEAVGGIKGAVIGWIAGPFIDSALQSGLTPKIAAARGLADLADAIRGKNPGRVNSSLQRLAAMTGKTAQLRALLSGGGPTAVPVAAQDQSTTPITP